MKKEISSDKNIQTQALLIYPDFEQDKYDPNLYQVAIYGTTGELLLLLATNDTSNSKNNLSAVNFLFSSFKTRRINSLKRKEVTFVTYTNQHCDTSSEKKYAGFGRYYPDEGIDTFYSFINGKTMSLQELKHQLQNLGTTL